MEDARALVLQRIQATLTDDPEADRPTAYALQLAEALVSACDPVPRAAVAAAGDGSLCVYWRHGPRTLQLFVPPSGVRQPYLYHRVGAEYGVADGVTPARIAAWMRWYVGGEMP